MFWANDANACNWSQPYQRQKANLYMLASEKLLSNYNIPRVSKILIAKRALHYLNIQCIGLNNNNNIIKSKLRCHLINCISH